MYIDSDVNIDPDGIVLFSLRGDDRENNQVSLSDSTSDPPIPPLAGPAHSAIPSMSLQFQPMLPAQQAQPYGFGLSQQFLPLGHANIEMSQPSQIQFPQPMQQVAGRPVVGMHSMPPGPLVPHDFQRNLPMSNNHMPGSGGPNLPLSSSYNVNTDFFGSQYQTQINDHRFPSGVQPWIPISNHNVNSATTMQKTGELEALLVVPVRIQCVLLYPLSINIVNKYA
ncbi:hypothetical protein CQW23_32570 [Capsicum baccatum]|uniref:Uncharacterized protein n=1 Tax=Capsicum baccatum TaxID=33114 RepID=A0A2G2V4C2_CAPBA|nr:hypothetical protein CQW23_32570 [Capsicum baccatum]